MSERTAAEIRIGGPIRRTILPDLCGVITVQQIALEWGEERFEPQAAEDLLDVLRKVDGTSLVVLRDAEANYGEFDELEGFLREHQIAYDRYSDGTCEWDCECSQFRPGMPEPRHQITNKNGQPVAPCNEVREVLELLEQGRGDEATGRLREILGEEVPPLLSFQIVP